MKLRYLRLARQRPPLQDLALTFPQDELLSYQPLSLRFIVGLNGSGKTTLLQTIAEIFACLDRDGQPPAFPFWLAYDLEIENQPRTVYLAAPHNQPASLVIFEHLDKFTDWDELPLSDDPRIWRSFAGSLPSDGEWELYIPGAVVAYTSGHTNEWKKIFAPHSIPLDQGDAIPPTPEDERPLGWDVDRENERNRQLGEGQSPLTALPPESITTQYPEKSFFIGPQQLTLASLLIMLKHLAQEGQDNDSLQAIYSELRLPWQAPLALSLSVNLDLINESEYATRLADLLKLASRIIREPEPGIWRQLIFELPGRAPKKKYNNAEIDETDSTVRALLKVLGNKDAEIFDAFKTLSRWQQNNLVRDLRLVLKKDEVKDALLLDWLSDGERMLLGRISLFYLLRDKPKTKRNALLILDEPETHFNDKWKRRLVNMLDDALRDSAHQIVISTHSSILLTDVFNTEISILKDGEVREPRVGTFGTLPSEIMRDIFDTENPIGDRAKAFLDAVLTLVEHPDLANRLWRALDENPNPVAGAWIGTGHPFGEIIQLFARSKKLQQRSPEQWLPLFQGLHRRASVSTDGPITLANVLEMLFNYVGGGYYQFELRRQHRRLTE